MQEWWSALSMTLRVLYCIAVPSTLLLLLQMLLTIVGGGHDGGVDISDTSGIDMPDTMDFDIDADTDVPDTIDGGNPADFGNLRLLTLQTLVTFLAVFGWVSIICISSGMPNLGGIAIGTACGLAMMFENGVLNLKNAIGETATVYLTIPPKNAGSGKITMRLQGRFGEFDAVNAGQTALPTGAQVIVTDVENDMLVVEQNG